MNRVVSNEHHHLVIILSRGAEWNRIIDGKLENRPMILLLGPSLGVAEPAFDPDFLAS